MNITILRNKENIGLILIIILVILNYGQLWTRGGYADDFVFISYTQNAELWEAITNWPFNGRLTQGILIPSLFKLSLGDEPGKFNWLFIQGLGLLFFIGSIILINVILKFLDSPWVIRFISCLVFAIYPIKNSTLFWPATIIGYVIALTIFLCGVAVYFSKARNNSDSILSLFIVFILFLIASLSIEQFIPLIILTIVFRIFFWKTNLKVASAHIFVGTSLVSIFLATNFLLVKSTRKIGHYLINEQSLFKNVINVTIKSSYNFIKNPFQYILDSYFWLDLKAAALQIEYFLIIIILICTIFIIKITTIQNNKKIYWLFIGGLIWWFISLSPLMLISYYLPDRIFYIPLIGAAVTISSLFYIINDNFPILRNIVLLILFLGFSMLGLTNLYSQNNYANRWKNESKLIDEVIALKNDIKPNMTIHLFNFPADFGPSPGIEDYFTFNGMVNFIYPENNIKGESQSNFIDVMHLPTTSTIAISSPLNFSPQSDNLVLLWNQNDNHLIKLKELKLMDTLYADQNKNSLYIKLIPANIQINTSSLSIHIPYLLILPECDLAILSLVAKPKITSIKKTRINIHSITKEGVIIPIDKWINKSTAKENIELKTSIFLNNFSEIKSVYFIDKNKITSIFPLE